MPIFKEICSTYVRMNKHWMGFVFKYFSLKKKSKPKNRSKMEKSGYSLIWGDGAQRVYYVILITYMRVLKRS